MDDFQGGLEIDVFRRIEDFQRVKDALDRGGVTVEDQSWLQQAAWRSEIGESERNLMGPESSVRLQARNDCLTSAYAKVVEAAHAARHQEAEAETAYLKKANAWLKYFVAGNPLADLERRFYPQMAHTRLARHFCEKARTSDTPQYWAGMAISSFEATGFNRVFFHAFTGMHSAEAMRLMQLPVMDTIEFLPRNSL